jgi:hypothetical protein
MVIFGGYFEVTKELNDLYIFDFVEEKWIQIFLEANSPVSPAKLIAAATAGSTRQYQKPDTAYTSKDV